MSPTLSSHGVVLVTAMAAVSGTVILLAFRLQKSFPPQQHRQILRSCLCSEGKRRDQKKKKKVHFADNVVDSRGDGDEFRRRQTGRSFTRNKSSSSSTKVKKIKSFNNGGRDCSSNYRGMPENRMALYDGILRDRVVHQRFTYSY